jgi:glycosyltransferase involved in cell wall biosynthesis
LRLKSSLSILFFCTFPQTNKNGVQRFAFEIIKGVRSKETLTYALFWEKENGIVRSFINLLKNFLITIKKANIIHFVVLTPYNIPFIIIAKMFRKKILISYHGNYLIETSITKLTHIFIPFWIADKISRLFSDMIVSPSIYLRDQLKINRDKSYIIPNPFNLQLLDNLTNNTVKTYPTEIVFATASNFNIKEKVDGVHFLIDAMDRIKDIKDVKLLVFGDGTYLDGFKTKYSNNQKIVFMGFRSDFRDFLKSVDAYIHISGLDNQPYAIIDALMQGKVVICNDLEGLIEMIDPNNNYVVQLDSSSISKTLDNVINEIKNNPAEFQEKGNKNKIFAINRYSADAVSKEYIKLYNKLLDNDKNR